MPEKHVQKVSPDQTAPYHSSEYAWSAYSIIEFEILMHSRPKSGLASTNNYALVHFWRCTHKPRKD